MERVRRCGFLGPGETAGQTPVWVRKNLVLFECPKSFVKADSLNYLESYAAWKQLGMPSYDAREAREADAFAVLDGELAEELKNESEDKRVTYQRRDRR